ncbi:MAG: hypothetical protein R6W82_01795, partial [bacterium]
MPQTRLRTGILFFFLLPLLSLWPTERPAWAQETARGLEDLFERGYILHDLNGDGIVDQLQVRILLPESADSPELAAAADLAARLGWETTAMDPGLALSTSEAGLRVSAPVLLLQPDETSLRGTDLTAAEASRGLAPGQGRVLRLPPGQRYAAGGAVVTGRDATGLLAAAHWLSARFPSVWAPDADSLHSVRSRLKGWLGAGQTGVTDLLLTSAVV